MMAVAISVNLAWRCFWVACRTPVVRSGDEEVEGDPVGCWFGTDGSMTVLLLPRMLIDASMRMVIGRAPGSAGSSSASTLLGHSSGARTYGGGGVVTPFCRLAMTSASLWDW